MSFTIGLVGKPSSGKSTFFKAATLLNVPTASYPFTTIKPNFGTGYVRVNCVEKDFNVKCQPRFGYCKNGERFVPVEIVDVAGLVPDAHKGKGLGNQFLNDLNQADVLIHVVDTSGYTNEKGEYVDSHDPAKDIEFLEKEIDLWYFSILNRSWKKISKGEIVKSIAEHLSSFKVNENIVMHAISNANIDMGKKWNEDEIKLLASDLRKITKPILIACNKIDVLSSRKNFERLKKEFPEKMIIPCSAESELALKEAEKRGIVSYIPGDKSFKILKPDELNEKQKKALEFINSFISDFGTGIQQWLNAAVFDFLKYIAVFPGGVNKLADKNGRILPDCFLMPENSTAKDFAYMIHTDIGRHFLYALDVRTKKRIGADYLLKNRDVIEIISTAK